MHIAETWSISTTWKLSTVTHSRLNLKPIPIKAKLRKSWRHWLFLLYKPNGIIGSEAKLNIGYKTEVKPNALRGEQDLLKLAEQKKKSPFFRLDRKNLRL